MNNKIEENKVNDKQDGPICIAKPDMYRWARTFSNTDITVIVKRVGVEKAVIEEWEEGRSQPTIHQARLLAKACHVDLAHLFLPDPGTATEVMSDEPLPEPNDFIRDCLERYTVEQVLQIAFSLQYNVQIGMKNNIDKINRTLAGMNRD